MFMQALSMSARAEIQITGGSDAIKVEANEVSLEDLLIALNKAFGLQYRSSANLSRSVSGTFAGILPNTRRGIDRRMELSEHDR
jgi:hypothetical protein